VAPDPLLLPASASAPSYAAARDTASALLAVPGHPSAQDPGLSRRGMSPVPSLTARPARPSCAAPSSPLTEAAPVARRSRPESCRPAMEPAKRATLTTVAETGTLMDHREAEIHQGNADDGTSRANRAARIPDDAHDLGDRLQQPLGLARSVRPGSDLLALSAWDGSDPDDFEGTRPRPSSRPRPRTRAAPFVRRPSEISRRSTRLTSAATHPSRWDRTRVTASPPTRLYIQQASGVEIQGYGGITTLRFCCASHAPTLGRELSGEWPRTST
jgi:hypothetical protein